MESNPCGLRAVRQSTNSKCKTWTAPSSSYRVEGIEAAGSGRGQATGVCENGIFTGASRSDLGRPGIPITSTCRIVGGSGIDKVNVIVGESNFTYQGRLTRLGRCDLTANSTSTCDEQQASNAFSDIFANKPSSRNYTMRKSCGPVTRSGEEVTVHYV